MKKSTFTEQQIALALQQAEGGTSVGGRKMRIAEATTWLRYGYRRITAL